ncbi:hypothetical protein D515_00921 [Grimontia indica]|uniref:Uncharacterized protein n=1 Tax=Grimontia indica TaxID=1056512 RepID=R1GUC3_9GAMM|nr:hypothetical protein D515_00921 [Grimontia indica]
MAKSVDRQSIGQTRLKRRNGESNGWFRNKNASLLTRVFFA